MRPLHRSHLSGQIGWRARRGTILDETDRRGADSDGPDVGFERRYRTDRSGELRYFNQRVAKERSNRRGGRAQQHIVHAIMLREFTIEEDRNSIGKQVRLACIVRHEERSGCLAREQPAVLGSARDGLDLESRSRQWGEARPPARRERVRVRDGPVVRIPQAEYVLAPAHAASRQQVVGRGGGLPDDLPVVGENRGERCVGQCPVGADEEARRTGGDPVPLQVDAVSWMLAERLSEVDFIPANREIVERLVVDVREGKV